MAKKKAAAKKTATKKTTAKKKTAKKKTAKKQFFFDFHSHSVTYRMAFFLPFFAEISQKKMASEFW